MSHAAAGPVGRVVLAVVILTGTAGLSLTAGRQPPGSVRGPLRNDEAGGDRDAILRHLASYELGKAIFFEETFQGNGRTCATCHDPMEGFSTTPARVKAIFREDRSHALFQPRDSDAGDGERWSILRTKALFAVEIPLHDDVWLEDDPARRTLLVRRGVPSIVNVAFTAPYQHDGRSETLEAQALDMIRNHLDAGRKPKRKELRGLVRFQNEVLSPARLAALVPADIALMSPEFSLPLPSEAAKRGGKVFEAHCGSCHAGELLNRPAGESGPAFRGAGVSERNAQGLPLQRLVFALAGGATTVVETPDPGRAAVTGRLDDLNMFDVPSLRGVLHTRPYFHDNSAATLRDVIGHYNVVFGFGIAGGDLEDLLAYLESL